MSKDKYPSIFSPQMEAIVFIILQIFYATRAVLRIFPSFSWGIFTHVTRLDQSRASENIWWIIRANIMRFLAGNFIFVFSAWTFNVYCFISIFWIVDSNIYFMWINKLLDV